MPVIIYLLGAGRRDSTLRLRHPGEIGLPVLERGRSPVAGNSARPPCGRSTSAPAIPGRFETAIERSTKRWPEPPVVRSSSSPRSGPLASNASSKPGPTCVRSISSAPQGVIASDMRKGRGGWRPCRNGSRHALRTQRLLGDREHETIRSETPASQPGDTICGAMLADLCTVSARGCVRRTGVLGGTS